MRIVTVIGARPQFIKAAAVSRAIAEFNSAQLNYKSMIKEIIVHTGQHFDANMSDVFFNELQIPEPVYHLEINSMTHGAMIGRMLEKIEEVIFHEKPDCLMVYGDTNSTLAGALAAKKNHIKIVHVEAGLRSYNMRMPEEVNRILTDRISDMLCCPTENAIENLEKEGFNQFPCIIAKTGDVMQDAALYYSKFSEKKSTILKKLGVNDNEFVLCTIHRAENTDNPKRLTGIISALNEISKQMRVLLPLHPRTRKIIADSGNVLEIETLDPVGYFDMIELVKHANIVMTDSGGLQKEAYFFNKFCLTLREETEWVELVKLGVNKLVGTDPDNILSAQAEVMNASGLFDKKLYGNGMASMNIVNLISASVF